MLVRLWGHSPTIDPKLASELRGISHKIAVSDPPDLESERLDATVALRIRFLVERAVMPLSVDLEHE
jgi:hypothetical protein